MVIAATGDYALVISGACLVLREWRKCLGVGWGVCLYLGFGFSRGWLGNLMEVLI